MDKINSITVAIRKDKIIALSFGITFIRFILTFFASALIFTNYQFHAVKIAFLILLIMYLDLLDGQVFRKSPLHNIQNLRIKRRLVDSVADKMVTHIVCLSLLIMDTSFIYLYSCILVRDIIISLYNIFIKSKYNTIIYPGKLAKLALFSVGISVIVYLVVDNSFIVFSVVFIMLILSSLAFRNYYFKFLTNKTKISSQKSIKEIF